MKIFEKEVFRLLGLLVKDLYYEARFESVSDVKQIVELLKEYTRSLEAHITHAEMRRQRSKGMTIFQKDVAHTLSLLNTKLYDCARFKSVSDVQQIVEFLKHFTLCLEGQIKHAELYPERLEE